MIDNIPVTAPIWKGVAEGDLRLIVKRLRDASFHFSDDTAKEWALGHDRVREAAELVNMFGLEFGAIEALHKQANPLVPLSDFVNAVLRDLRKRGGRRMIPNVTVPEGERGKKSGGRGDE